MNPALFRKLVERKLFSVGTTVGVEFNTYLDSKKVKSHKGVYTITAMYAHPLIPGTQIEIEHEGEPVRIELKNIKMISGMTPTKLAAQNGIRPDGKDNDAPKRRGRKPKVRNVEEEWTV